VARSTLSKVGRRVSRYVKPRLYAGGIVVRVTRGQPEVLIVTTRRSRKRWVLPKGRVERGEAASAAALREVREESGVNGRLIGFAGDAESWTTKGRVRIEYYLIAFRRAKKQNDEEREIAWCAVEDAIQRLTYASARRVLLTAHHSIVDYVRAASKT
jgi:8-oxo-dGTP pyrophosphatase MutT (NUDIX family)